MDENKPLTDMPDLPTYAAASRTTTGGAAPRSRREQRAAAPAVPPRRMELADLLGPAREVILVHKDAEYRLRLTSNDKLILTK